MQSLIHTLTDFATGIDSQKANTVCGFAKWFGEKIGMTSSVSEQFAITINYLFFVSSILFFFLSRKKWQEALFLSGILVSFIPSNWEYTLVYYLPVLLLFMKEHDKVFAENNAKTNILILYHAVSFALVFSIDFFMLYFRYGLITGIFLVTYLMIAVNMIHILKEKCRSCSFILLQ